MKKHLFSLSFLVLLLFNFSAYAQIEPEELILDEDSLLLLGKTDDDTIQIDEIEDVVEVIEVDLNNLPSAHIYDSWNTEHIRVNRTNSRDLKDTILVLLEGDRNFVFPYKGKVISTFGPRGRRNHSGIDIKLNNGDPVVAAFDGVVRVARNYSGYGKLVVVRHYNGLETVYAHLSKISVKLNQEVKAGDLLGLGGRTGRATTEHLHFETRYKGEVFHPCHILDFDHHCLVSDTLFLDKQTFKMSRTPVKNHSVLASNSTVETNNDSDEAEQVLDKKPEPITKSDIVDSKPQLYHVKSGDTLYKISLKYRIPVKKLCEINKIKETDILSIGQKIQLM
ncbi:MAG: peptidoglycan DD-metalloendopeptidase family protein [Bacteroidales bacterium]|nr:peptidoglycan DD-metalloendopeptidase family protein [Bacteroidales bacterium]